MLLKKRTDGTAVDSSMAQFIIHSALDVVDEQQWKKQDYYLKQVDQFRGLAISSFVTPSSTLIQCLPIRGNDLVGVGALCTFALFENELSPTSS